MRDPGDVTFPCASAAAKTGFGRRTRKRRELAPS